MEKAITCIGCKKTPEQIDEYIVPSKEMKITPTAYVRMEEGTFNRFKRGQFYCTMCYIKAGMPTYR